MEDTQYGWQVAAVTRTGGWEGLAAGQVQVSDQVPGVVSALVILPQFRAHSLGSQTPLSLCHLPNGPAWEGGLCALRQFSQAWHGWFRYGGE